jgi:hypothetical protein
MVRRIHHTFGGTLVVAIIVAGVFVVSLLLFLLRDSPSVQRVLFFPDETTGELGGELRELPRQRSREEEVDRLLREIVLGPTMLGHGRLVPRDTTIHSVLLRDRSVYVNLSEHLAFPGEELLYDFSAMITGIRKTIEFNYPRIDEIRIFVEGREQDPPEKIKGVDK